MLKVYCHEVPGSVRVTYDYYTVHNGYKIRRERDMWVVYI